MQTHSFPARNPAADDFACPLSFAGVRTAFLNKRRAFAGLRSPGPLRLRLPALYPLAFYAKSGGLISYGFDPVNQFQQGAGYVDRILRGAKPADLPVQYPTKLQLAINLKTAKTLGLEVPPMLLARADEVIE